MDYSRNSFLISKETQESISHKTLLICGTGMGSLIAEMAVRTGFKKLIIADGDDVDLSNLNRQNFTEKNIGKNKALELSERLLEINPLLEIECYEKYLQHQDLKNLIPRSDFVINTIDFDSSAFISCHKLCSEFNKIELFPTNIGFGGALIISDKSSPNWEEYFKLEKKKDLKASLLSHIFEHDSFSQYSQNKFKEYQESKLEYDPQIAAATLSCSNLVITALVQIVSGQSLRTFPSIIIHDPTKLLFNNKIKTLKAA